MNKPILFKATVKKFHSKNGWWYVEVPKKHKDFLQQKRQAWGKYPISVRVGNTSWITKLMMKKGGIFLWLLKFL